ncbi:MAG: EamA family transporter [Phycisphaerae bacterium]
MDTGPARIKIALAFAAVYLIWGSTYLAIRFAVQTLPPLTMASVRFLVAGSVLYVLARRRGAEPGTWIHWRSATIIGGLLLLGGNGGVCLAERVVPSGIACLLITTVPLWMTLLEAIRPGGSLPPRIAILGLVLGFGGVYLLVDPGLPATDAPLDRIGVALLLGASLFWSMGSLYSKHASLPRSPFLSTAMQMLAGSVMLAIAGLITGEWGSIVVERMSFKSVAALAYLIVFGALVGFTAYVWLLQVASPAKVATYAYVNPVVAVLLGWALADETVTPQTLIAMVIIVLAVVCITATRSVPDYRRRERGDRVKPAPASQTS